MAHGLRDTTRSEVTVPKEYEYTASLTEFLDFFGVPAGEEPRSFNWYQDKITLRTREIIL